MILGLQYNVTMNRLAKRLSPFIAALLLGTQLVAAAHAAEHGFAKHEHDGEACVVYQYWEQRQCEAHDVAGFHGLAERGAPPCATARPLHTRLVGHRPYSTRGPPLFS